MPPAARYDAVVVGGGLAGVATATLLAKRGRRVALCEPRPAWGGTSAEQRLGGATVGLGPRAVVGHERMGWADTYFEAVGMSLPLMMREGATFRRDPVQLVWGAHRMALTVDRGEVVEELRREYRVATPEVGALLADLDAAYDVLAPRVDPSPFEDAGPAWPRLRRAAAARTFAARFGGLSASDYARARSVSAALVPYLDAWRIAWSSDGDVPENWVFRTALAHRGVVSLAGGIAGVSALLASRFEAHGGDVLRTPVTAIDAGAKPFVETDARRLDARALIVNARRRPGVAPTQHGWRPMTAAVFSVPSACVPDAMAAYLLVTDGSETWSLARQRVETGGSASREALVVSCRGRLDGRDAARLAGRLESLMPFAAGQLTFEGMFCDEDVPEPADPKLWGEVSWRARRFGWEQAGRTPVWWLEDKSAPWLGDAGPYRTALAVDRLLRLG
jgi:phytoene dehydrogenase-like protein